MVTSTLHSKHFNIIVNCLDLRIPLCLTGNSKELYSNRVSYRDLFSFQVADPRIQWTRVRQKQIAFG